MNVKGSITDNSAAIVNAADCNPFPQNGTADDAIKASIIRTLNWHTHLPYDDISVTVKSGYVELMGRVQWMYQKMVIAAMVQKTEGVRGIINGIVTANTYNPTLSH